MLENVPSKRNTFYVFPAMVVVVRAFGFVTKPAVRNPEKSTRTYVTGNNTYYY